ncbi:piggyBac transposable element-derived protein 4-like [Diachasma alloeum]|uniref:piggyBac transposable element-derived protein 4-like n=1 Tax=Diachasma alloeum TaxID=454923 RepID=UPI0007382B4F|nr:piggyBac transposable element-derived protein 4-like [Diachasma alloeum]
MGHRRCTDSEIQNLLEDTDFADTDSDSDEDSSSDNSDDSQHGQGDNDTEILKSWNMLEDHAFKWEHIKNYHSKREVFTGNPGPCNEAVGVIKVVESFEIFSSPHFVQILVTETNQYAEQEASQRQFLKGKVKLWTDVTVAEMYTYLGVLMLMSFIQKPTIKMFLAKKRLLSTPGFNDIMSRNRFEFINKYLHFIDNSTRSSYTGPPQLFKIHPVIEHLQEKFRNSYLPDQKIAIDESLTLWKDRLSIKQFLPLKSAKFGVKWYQLCESTTGYLWNFVMYLGKDTDMECAPCTRDTPKTSAIVLKLMEPLLGQGYTLWMDNFYNSPALAFFLKSHEIDCVGTLRLNRKNVPVVVKEKKIKKGEIVAQHCDAVTVMRWSDKKMVSMISTYHDDAMTTSLNKRKQETIKRNYVIALIEGILAKYHRRVESSHSMSDVTDLRRLSERHFIKKVPRNDGKAQLQRRCVVCTRHDKKKTTVYWCDVCSVGLFIQDCFEIYHTKENF